MAWLPLVDLLSPPRRHHRPAPRLSVTRLEDRDCPAAPGLADFAARQLGDYWVLSGRVTDEAPGQATVAITGDASGAARMYSDGKFEFIVQKSGTGTVYARATDIEGLQSEVAGAAIGLPSGNQAPHISLNVSYLNQRNVRLSGTVYDESPTNLTVTLGGKVSGNTVTTTGGWFTIDLAASGLGDVTASVTDGQGVASNVPRITLTSSPPTISNFTVTITGNTYTFTGKVTDESAAGLSVTFGGDISEISGSTRTVGNDTWFTYTVTLTPGTTGLVTAKTTDWWGLDSNLATCTI